MSDFTPGTLTDADLLRTVPLIKERLVDTGIVRYVYYDYPLSPGHRHSFLAARAAQRLRVDRDFLGNLAALVESILTERELRLVGLAVGRKALDCANSGDN